MQASPDLPLAPLREPRPWSGLRWAVLVCSIFGLHAGLIVFLSRSPAGSQTKRSDTTSFRILADTPQAALVTRDLSLLNPALFGAANARTFSGLAWIRRPASKYQIPSWTEPPAYLELDDHIAETAPIPKMAPSDDPLAEKLTPLVTQITLSPSGRSSILRIGQLPGGRALVKTALLPIQTFTDVLTNSIVQAVVDSHGAVISARLISRSGSNKADADALSITRLARFRPRAPANFVTAEMAPPDWATLIFQWFTIEPAPAARQKP